MKCYILFEGKNTTANLKKSKILQDDIETYNICNTLRESTSFKNVATYYEIAVF